MDTMKANYQMYNPCSKNKDGINTKFARNYKFTCDSAPDFQGEEHEDEDYSMIPSLSYDLEDLIFARLPRSQYWKLSFLNTRSLALFRSGELFKIRREIGFNEPSVFMLASGDNTWWSFDREFKSCRKLPDFPADPYFRYGEKESVCAGTHLLVSGWDVDGQVIWRYDLDTDQWEKSPCMQTTRCLYASATCGNYAYVAGGIDETNDEVYNVAERYNSHSNSWESLPRMNIKRKLCSGFYMDNRFYVVGGRNEDGELTCGEYFDEANKKWELIPNMLKDDPVRTSHAPPLLCVVNNELYLLETSSNELKMYSKKTNTWRRMGQVPVKSNSHKGWGVAFKSLGDELVVMGASSDCSGSMAMYTCCPNPDASELHWRPLDSGRNWFSHFILNCSVMIA